MEYKLYSSVSNELLIPKLVLLVDEKISIFKSNNLYDANYSEIIGILTGYNLIDTNLNCGGFCNYIKKEIAIVDQCLKTLFHEVGHTIQAEIEMFEKESGLLSEQVYIEQQCETIAFYMYNLIFTKNQIQSSEFDSYFTREDVRWLADWYGNSIENDFKNL